MEYPKKIHDLELAINDFARYKCELGATGVQKKVNEIEMLLKEKIKELEAMEENTSRLQEPNLLEDIRKNSPKNKRECSRDLSDDEYISKLKGAIYGRFAGCALGAPVELMGIKELESFAKLIGMEFPPKNYWLDAPVGYLPRYKVGMGKQFTLPVMNSLPPDDDIIYTLLSMMVMEEKGSDFSTSDVGEFWVKYLPNECTYTAERISLVNLQNGIDPKLAGSINNPYTEWIGAAIRCDGWAFVNPGNPERASEWAYRDAYVSHRRSGIYSAMYFAAVIASAFTSDSIIEALEKGFNYIPKNAEFTKQIQWAMDIAPTITNYKEANEAVTKRFEGMDWVHAINNACLTIWGVCIGQKDFTKGISETVAMAYDNDCTAATVGSILGAFMGVDGVPKFWYEPWNNTIISYLHGVESFELDDVVRRFSELKKIFE